MHPHHVDPVPLCCITHGQVTGGKLKQILVLFAANYLTGNELYRVGYRDAQGGDDIEVQGVSAHMQQSVIQGH